MTRLMAVLLIWIGFSTQVQAQNQSPLEMLETATAELTDFRSEAGKCFRTTDGRVIGVFFTFPVHEKSQWLMGEPDL